MIDLSTFKKLWNEYVKKREEFSKIDVVKYWDERAQDYAEAVKLSNFELGRKVTDTLLNEKVIDSSSIVLDIGAGPGTITIPLAKIVKKVVAIEPSREMIKYLEEFSKENNVNNIEVINKRWEEISDTDIHEKFDLVLCSHVLWIFPSIEEQINRIINASRNYCCIVESVKSKDWTDRLELYKKLGVEHVVKEFPDYIIIYNILYSMGISANIKIITYNWPKTYESAIKYFKIFTKRYKGELASSDEEIIESYVKSKLKNGYYNFRGKAAIIWWCKRCY